MKALILEDNFSLAQFLQKILSTKGYSVFLSCSWSEASALIDKHSFDFLILDILLPDKKGFEVLKILSQKMLNPSLKIALISGFVDENSVYKNVPHNLKDNYMFFKKPIDESALLNFLQTNKPSDSEKKEDTFCNIFFEKDKTEKPLDCYFSPNKTFDSEELIQCIFLAHLKKFTGNFQTTINDKKESLIQFYNGHIIHATSPNKTSYLGTLLVEHGLSLSKDIELILKNKNPNKPIGEQLVEKELLSPYMLNFMLKEQIKIRLSELMSYPSFKLNIVETPLDDNKPPDFYFNETDFIEWLADSTQTELTEDFLNKFYFKIKSGVIRKSKEINQDVILQKQFLQDYNLWFKNLKDKSEVKNLSNNSKNQYLKFLYFGLLTKSIYLQNTQTASIDLKKMERLLDSIIEKDVEDLFSILNLPWNASVKEVEKNYKRLIQDIHPDLIPSTAKNNLKQKAEKAFRKVIQSYKVLKDEKKREEYLRIQEEEAFVNVMNKYKEGLTRIKQEKYRMALASFSEIENHKQAPQNTCLYILWATLKSKDINLEKNQKQLMKIKRTIDTCPISLRTSPLYWYVKGLFFAQNKHYQGAKELFQKSLAVQKSFVEARKELMLVNHIIRSSKSKKNILNLFLKKSS